MNNALRNSYGTTHDATFPGMPADSQRPTPPANRTPVETIRARVRRYNSDIDGKSDTFRAAVLLLVAVEYGQNVELLTRRTGIDRPFVSKCARRLIDNGVWSGGQTVADWTAGDEASGSFWNDVAVAEGKLCRRTLEDGTIEWAPAGYWNKGYHFVDPGTARQLNTVYFDAGPQPDQSVPLDMPRENATPGTPQSAAADPVAGPQPAGVTGGEGTVEDSAGPKPGDPADSQGRDTAGAASSQEPPQPVETPSANLDPTATADTATADAPPSGKPAGDGQGGNATANDDDDTPPSLAEIFSDAVWIR